MTIPSLLLTAVATTVLQVQSADTSWSAVYLRDLAEARRVIADNHPGPVDRANPAFALSLDSAYDAARRMAPLVRDYTGFASALEGFGRAFQDAHLNIRGRSDTAHVRAAGIYTRFENGRLEVAEVAARYGGRVPVGSLITQCDGIGAVRLVEDLVARRGRRSVVADLYTIAPLLLVDFGDPSARPLQSCDFAVGQDTIRTRLLWETNSRSQVEEVASALNGFPQQRIALKREGDRLWVSLPTFAVRDEDQVAAMTGLIRSLGAELRSLSGVSVVVLDLRGNSGGSSLWGNDIAGVLFGSEWLNQARAWLTDGVYTEWRVSGDNLQAVARLAAQTEAQGRASASLRILHDSMTAALERGDELLPTSASPSRRTGVSAPDPSGVPYHVVVITSASCFSACLDFMDLLRLHPSVTHVGQPTAVDTDYMENWGHVLPSGFARIAYPMKVYRNRRRLNNEGYSPHVARDDLHDDPALARWISNSIDEWRARSPTRLDRP